MRGKTSLAKHLHEVRSDVEVLCHRTCQFHEGALYLGNWQVIARFGAVSPSHRRVIILRASLCDTRSLSLSSKDETRWF
jgi:thiamine phosphate synthase YjbQ (UPF0047 family)